jgi:adenine phosphoribosyltransferase
VKTSEQEYNLDKIIRKVPNFPKKGILFYDITSILVTPEAFNYCLDRTEAFVKTRSVNAIAAIESRGFLFAAPVANRLKLPLLILRKKGKLPGETYSASFKLEYGEDTVEVHKEDLKKDMRLIIIDDLIATGGTLKAAISLIEMAGAKVEGIASIIGLPFLNYQSLLEGYDLQTLVDYHNDHI